MSGFPTTSFAFSLSPGPKQDVMSERKMKKPIMEKMRRQRMNDSLNALKDLLLTFAPYDRSAKLEKADILERTVEMIKQIQSKRGIPPSVISVQSAMDRGHREGFDEGFACASRAVFDYIASTFPPQTANSQAQQFQMGLISHLRNSLPSSSSSEARIPTLPIPVPAIASTSFTNPGAPSNPKNLHSTSHNESVPHPVTVVQATCESKWSPLTPPSDSSDSSPSSSPKTHKITVRDKNSRKRVWQPWQ